MDIPTTAEGNFFTTTLRKFLWVFFQVLFYAFRPILMSPYSPGRFEAANWILCVAFDLVMIRYFGFISIGYFLLSMLLGLGPHPMAGHFIAGECYDILCFFVKIRFLIQRQQQTRQRTKSTTCLFQDLKPILTMAHSTFSVSG